jgi:hypothetical protein
MSDELLANALIGGATFTALVVVMLLRWKREADKLGKPHVELPKIADELGLKYTPNAYLGDISGSIDGYRVSITGGHSADVTVTLQADTDFRADIEGKPDEEDTRFDFHDAVLDSYLLYRVVDPDEPRTLNRAKTVALRNFAENWRDRLQQLSIGEDIHCKPLLEYPKRRRNWVRRDVAVPLVRAMIQLAKKLDERDASMISADDDDE